MTTAAPSKTNKAASAAPCPRAAPLTIATLPSSLPMLPPRSTPQRPWCTERPKVPPNRCKGHRDSQVHPASAATRHIRPDCFGAGIPSRRRWLFPSFSIKPLDVIPLSPYPFIPLADGGSALSEHPRGRVADGEREGRGRAEKGGSRLTLPATAPPCLSWTHTSCRKMGPRRTGGGDRGPRGRGCVLLSPAFLACSGLPFRPFVASGRAGRAAGDGSSGAAGSLWWSGAGGSAWSGRGGDGGRVIVGGDEGTDFDRSASARRNPAISQIAPGGSLLRGRTVRERLVALDVPGPGRVDGQVLRAEVPGQQVHRLGLGIRERRASPAGAGSGRPARRRPSAGLPASCRHASPARAARRRSAVPHRCRPTPCGWP